ncbi:pectate lyase-like adhesive domain-containing protein [Carnobacterium maltaromaticum]|uniref:pectate lyase-like adhesive domain-containing protein n=1 Tax=Carnobacterium maltaromaticum TaxID=2751 RepID=UPI001071B8DA|nr:pectate lyase-like adhesive domain-containing protein [Carnobacterium maltaromaticum]TFJ72380.1 cell surface protein [Carnobacterium maltaromaticum]TFJ77293.1 cell surface protein [Carnobacterium maltaromaticum]
MKITHKNKKRIIIGLMVGLLSVAAIQTRGLNIGAFFQNGGVQADESMSLQISEATSLKDTPIQIVLTDLPMSNSEATAETQESVITIDVPEGLAFNSEETSWLNAENPYVKVNFNQETQQVGVTVLDSGNNATKVGTVNLSLSGKVAGKYELTAKATYQGQEFGSNSVMLEVQADLEETNSELETPEVLTLDETISSDQPVSDSSIEQSAEQSAMPENRGVARAVGEIDVNSWDSFANAMKDTSISKINLTASFANTRTAGEGDPNNLATTQITRDIEINGNGFRIDFQGTSIWLGETGTARPTFHMHDIVLAQRYAGGYSEDIVGSRLVGGYTGKWNYRFGNVTTEASVQRLARATYAQVTVYGTMDLNTRAENFYTGSFIMEPGTNYKGNVNYYDFSVVWYNLAARAGDTGQSREFTVGADSKVRMSQTQTSGVSYPAVYQYYQAMTIGENAVFNVAMPGNAVRFDAPNSSFTAKKGSIVNLTSKRDSGAVVSYNTTNSTFKTEPGAYFYTIGKSNTALINISSGSNNSLDIQQPAQYDIRNLATSASSYAVGINYATNKMSITDSDIDLWKMGVDVAGPSSLTYAKVGSLTASGAPNSQVVASTDADLKANFKTNLFRRIAGMNQLPEVEFTEVTDADLTVKARVKIGMVPDNNGADETGHVNYVPVYASAGQATVTITDPANGLSYANLPTDANGYVRYTVPDFYQAGTKLTATAIRGPYESEELAETTVIDKTPPTPAEVTSRISPFTTVFTGINGEPGATLYYTLNGTTVPGSTVVKEDGTWEIPAPETKLVLGNVLQFILTDTEGNANPLVDTVFHDATFKAATKVTVADGELAFLSAPTKLSFGEELKVSAKEQTYPLENLEGQLKVQDTRAVKGSWTLTAKVDKVLTSGTGHTLPNAIRHSLGGNTTVLSDVSTKIYQHTNTDEAPFSVSDTWTPEGDGLSLTVPAGAARSESYEGTILWTLQNTPDGE